jgi:hypothetical protein
VTTPPNTPLELTAGVACAAEGSGSIARRSSTAYR